MREKKGPEVKEFAMSQPIEGIHRGQNFGTMSADDVVCLINAFNETCTLTFLQQHPIPKRDAKGLTLSDIETELVLEVKLPLESVWRLAFFLTGIFKNAKQCQKQGIAKLWFGPAFVEKKEKSRDEKSSNTL